MPLLPGAELHSCSTICRWLRCNDASQLVSPEGIAGQPGERGRPARRVWPASREDVAGQQRQRAAAASLDICSLVVRGTCLKRPRGLCTMRFGSTAKVLLKCKLKYYRISECFAVPLEGCGAGILPGSTSTALLSAGSELDSRAAGRHHGHLYTRLLSTA